MHHVSLLVSSRLTARVACSPAAVVCMYITPAAAFLWKAVGHLDTTLPSGTAQGDGRSQCRQHGPQRVPALRSLHRL